MRVGHSLRDIPEYTLGQFTMFLDAAEEITAAERMETVTDLSAVVGSLFSGESQSPIVEHTGLLIEASAGVKQYGDRQD